MNLLLSEVLPLRTSADLGDYSEDAVLPVVYGDLSQSAVPVVKLSATEYLAADHPATVTAVFIDDQETKAWTAATKVDASGRAYCAITLAAPPDASSVVTCAMKGKRDASTGALIEHPADILMDVLSMSGKSWNLSRLKPELPGIRIAGRLDKAQSVRAWLDEISASCGVVWAERFAAAYPAEPGVSARALDARSCQVNAAGARLDDAADRLRIAFDWHAGKGAYAQYMEFSARPGPFGADGVAPVLPVEAPWLRQPADAVALGTRLLSRLAAQRVAVEIETGERIAVGDWVTVDHPCLPVSGPRAMMALSIDYQPGKPSRRAGGEIAWGSMPTVTMSLHARAIRPKAQGGIDIAYAAGIATFTILGPDGKPLPHAQVSLDGGQARTTNAQGKVSFDAHPGRHLISVSASGYVPFELEITL